jgi:hypothetical protein
MKTAIVLATAMLFAPILFADSHHIEVDDNAEFSAFKTFAMREGRTTSRRAEINNKLLLKNLSDVIRSGLSAKGLIEAQDRPDLVVTFSLAEEGQRGTVGRGLRNVQVISRSEGQLVIELTSRATNSLAWYGIYTDDERDAAKLAKRLPGDAKKLIAEYPPKKKK